MRSTAQQIAEAVPTLSIWLRRGVLGLGWICRHNGSPCGVRRQHWRALGQRRCPGRGSASRSHVCRLDDGVNFMMDPDVRWALPGLDGPWVVRLVLAVAAR